MIRGAQTIIISDYNKGFLELEDIENIISIAKTNSTVILDTKRFSIIKFWIRLIL
jgi:bifunctional ADP-heptose synthase (sugar kinase/adenylyltransferase)